MSNTNPYNFNTKKIFDVFLVRKTKTGHGFWNVHVFFTQLSKIARRSSSFFFTAQARQFYQVAPIYFPEGIRPKDLGEEILNPMKFNHDTRPVILIFFDNRLNYFIASSTQEDGEKDNSFVNNTSIQLMKKSYLRFRFLLGVQDRHFQTALIQDEIYHMNTVDAIVVLQIKEIFKEIISHNKCQIGDLLSLIYESIVVEDEPQLELGDDNKPIFAKLK